MGCCGGEDEKADRRPPKSRSPLKKNVCCTDIIFLIIFVLFWAGMLYIAVYAVMRGDALRLVYGYDTFGNTCNRKNNPDLGANYSLSGQDTSNMTKLFYLDLDSYDDLEKSLQVCVTECPDRMLESIDDVADWCEERNVNLCTYDVSIDEIRRHGSDGRCPTHVYPSFSLLNRCVPNYLNFNLSGIQETASKVLTAINADDFARKVLSDLYETWREMLILCAISLGIGLLLVFLIRYIAAIMVWVIVILAALGSIAGTLFLWWTWWDTKKDLDRAQENFATVPILDVDVSNEMAFLIFAIVASVLTVILLLVLIVMRSRLSLVVALFHEAGKFFLNIPLLLIQPLWTFLFLMAFLVFWVIVLAFICTSDEPTPNGDRHDELITVDYKERDPVQYMWWYYVVGLIWTSEFILACQQLVISAAVAEWYFSRDKSKLSCTPCKAVGRLVLHHIGSVAFGAFIITLVKLPRLILMYIQRKCKGVDNPCAQCCLKCCICCLWCLEKCLKFLNQNAYTIVVIEGKSFCSAARKAFSIIANNVLRVAAINSVGDFVLFLGKVGVMAATAAIGVVWFKKLDVHCYAIPVILCSMFAYIIAHIAFSIYGEIPELHYYAIPVLLVCVFAFFIAHCFLTIYEMVVDTLLLCFCEDCELNDGTPGKQYFMSQSLMEFVNNSSEAIKNLERSRREPTKVDPAPDYEMS